jgi:hypothetical protein
MTSVVVLRWAEEPGIKAVEHPQGTSVGIFIDDGFGAGGSHWVVVPVVRPFQGFVS